MPKSLIDLLWRDHPDAPTGGTRGPRARHSVTDVIERAVALADTSGLTAVTIRALADSLDTSPMSVYTHVNSRDDLLVLMADAVHATMELPTFGRAGWRTRVRRVTESNLALLTAHPWLLEVHDPRLALGPGTITKYDHELHAFDDTGLTDLQRDASLTLLLDFVGASVGRRLDGTEDFGPAWTENAARLQAYVDRSHPLAQRVGEAAGAAMGTPYSATHAWKFGLDRILAGLAELID